MYYFNTTFKNIFNIYHHQGGIQIMNKDFKELIQIFKTINKRGYTKGINNK